jgi:hypothetical protein
LSIWPLCHMIFVHRWSCDMWLLVVRVVVCRSVYDMWGVGRTVWFLGCHAALASRLLRLLLSFDYQNHCLLFLKLQVQDQKWLFGKLSKAYFKIHPTCVRGFYASVWILSNQVLFAFLSLFGCFNNTPKNQYYDASSVDYFVNVSFGDMFF